MRCFAPLLYIYTRGVTYFTINSLFCCLILLNETIIILGRFTILMNVIWKFGHKSIVTLIFRSIKQMLKSNQVYKLLNGKSHWWWWNPSQNVTNVYEWLMQAYYKYYKSIIWGIMFNTTTQAYWGKFLTLLIPHDFPRSRRPFRWMSSDQRKCFRNFIGIIKKVHCNIQYIGV